MAHRLYIKYTYICIMHRISTSNIYRVCETSDCLDCVATAKTSLTTKNNSWLIWHVKVQAWFENIILTEFCPIECSTTRTATNIALSVQSVLCSQAWHCSHRWRQIQFCLIENCIYEWHSVNQFKQTVSIVCIIDVYCIQQKLLLHTML